jgi:LacI family transcriptional regulator
MTTLQDVADRAGVAPITVSRVINNSGYVSDTTRRRVEHAIVELEYVPNVLARSLRSRQTNTLALVLTDIANPFWTTVARGVEDAASAAGFNVIFCNTDESEDAQDQYLRMLLQKQVDGVLLVPARSKPDSVLFIQKQDTPVVVLDRRVPGAQVDGVRCDSEEGAYRLVYLLLSLGHRRIAMLSGPKDVSTAVDRVAGYRRGLTEAGVAIDDLLILYGEFTQASGFEMARRAMALLPRPTALFAANNFIATGAIRALRKMNLYVPDDVALVSFDDFPPTLLIDPFMTVANQPAYEMGRRATELLLARLDGEESEAPQEIILPTEIIVRRSSGEGIEN